MGETRDEEKKKHSVSHRIRSPFRRKDEMVG